MTKENYNLFSLFDESNSQDQSKPILILEDGTEYNYDQINSISSQIASYFMDSGILPGERISVQVDKSPESLCLYLACLRAGLTYHPLNPDYTESELEFFISNAEPSLIVCSEEKIESFKSLARANNISHVYTLNHDGNGTLIEHSKNSMKDFVTFSTPPDHIAALLYSSGTTGRPKGIMLTHENLISNTVTLSEYWEFSRKDVLLHALPIFHDHALFEAKGCALYSGASI